MRMGKCALYITCLLGAGTIGNRIEHYRTSEPLRTALIQKTNEVDKLTGNLNDTTATLGKYTLFNIGSKQLKINPDGTMSVSDIAGERMLPTSPHEYRQIFCKQ